MIHDVTIPFSFDTTPIEKQIANIGESEVKKLIHDVTLKGIYDALPSKMSYGYYSSNAPTKDNQIDWKRYLDERVDKWLDAHAQDIIDEAALLMAMRAGRKKAWREVLEELKEERDAE